MVKRSQYQEYANDGFCFYNRAPIERSLDQTSEAIVDTPPVVYPKLKIRRFACDNDCCSKYFPDDQSVP